MMSRSILDSELIAVRDDVLRMGSLVSHSTEDALEALIKMDRSKAQDVVNNDDEIDQLHHRLEEFIITSMATQQPAATDLRTLIAALLITNELERMGDHAEGIAKTVLRRSDSDQLEIPSQLMLMGKQVISMIQKAMEAYVSNAPAEAELTAAMDDEVDTAYRELFNLLVERMGSGQLATDTGTYLLWTGHNLERIGDRVTNICERIVYARTGAIEGLN